jgi:hypothetical protein
MSPSLAICRAAASPASLRFAGSSQWAGSILRFHSSHFCRDFSVLRSASTVKPICRAKAWAPAPTSRWWSVCSITALATLEGVRTPSRAATPPARLSGPCMQQESS